MANVDVKPSLFPLQSKPDFIYVLSDEKGIRYIGKAKSVKGRYASHLYEARHGHAGYKNHWLRKLLSDGREPNVSVIHEVPSDESADWEKWWISLGRAKGWRLTNESAGGEGRTGIFLPHRPETKEKIRRALKGRKHEPRRCVNMAKAWADRLRPVMQYDLNGNFVKEFPSINQARASTGITGIDKCVAGIHKQAGGFIWKRDGVKQREKAMPKPRRGLSGGMNPLAAAVQQCDLLGAVVAEFPSQMDAARATGIPNTHISKSVMSGSPVGRWIWKRKNPPKYKPGRPRGIPLSDEAKKKIGNASRLLWVNADERRTRQIDRLQGNQFAKGNVMPREVVERVAEFNRGRRKKDLVRT